jgi:hypothetical protein
MAGLLTGHCHLKEHLFKPRLVSSPKCERCKQSSEMASYILHDCKVLATKRFKHHFMRPGDFEDISVSQILPFVQGAGMLNS